MKLGELVTISTGFQVRSKLTADDSGSHKVIQMRNVCDQTGELREAKENTFYQVTPNPKSVQKYELCVGDVLLLTRGRYNPATLICGEAQGFVAAGQFSVLKVNTDICLPEYLCWFLNRAQSQNYFNKLQCGTGIPILTKEHIANFEIALPSIEVQQKVVKVAALSKREQRLLDQLKDKRQVMALGICRQLINN